jgi:hypothetical protein
MHLSIAFFTASITAPIGGEEFWEQAGDTTTQTINSGTTFGNQDITSSLHLPVGYLLLE